MVDRSPIPSRLASRDTLDAIDDPERWIRAGVEGCQAIWERVGRRYRRRLVDNDRARDAGTDICTLAARRLVPLGRPVLRPLPGDDLEPVARAFNRLDPADRYALLRLDDLAPLRGPRAEHAASAFARLAEAMMTSDEPPVGGFGDGGPRDGGPRADVPRADVPRADVPRADGPRADGPRADGPVDGNASATRSQASSTPGEDGERPPPGVGAID